MLLVNLKIENKTNETVKNVLLSIFIFLSDMGMDALIQDAFIDDVQMDSTPIQECVEIETHHPMPPISKWFKYF